MTGKNRKLDIDVSNVSSNPSLPADYLEESDEVEEEGDEWSETWIANEIEKRKEQNRDIAIGIVAEDAERGVGKSIFALLLALKSDENGFTEEKVGLTGDKILELLHVKDGVDYGSAVIADEIHRIADSRRATSSVNVQLTQAMAMARFRESYLIYTLPMWNMVDSRVRSQTAILIVCSKDQIGQARVYEIRTDDLDGGDIMTKYRETVNFPNLEDNEIYGRMEEMKAEQFDEVVSEHLDDGKSEEQEEYEDAKAEAVQKAIELKGDNPDMGSRRIANHEEMPENPKTGKKFGKSAVHSWLSEAGFYDD